MTTPTVDVTALAAELVTIAATIETLAERRDSIKALLIEGLPVGSHAAGDYKVTVKAGARRLDTTALAAAYPVAAHPELYRPAVDTAAVKAHIAPVVLAAFQTAGAPTVTVA